MELSNPNVLWFLLFVPLLAILRRRQEARCAVSFPPLQYSQAGSGRTIWGRALVPLELLVVASTIVALAGPSSSIRMQSLEENGLDLALVLDVSASMQAADFPPNRLEVLKQLASELLLQSGPNRVAVYAFAGHTFTQSPLTSDRSSVLALVDSLAYESIHHGRSGGTALGDALLIAGDALVSNRIEDRDQVLVLITDGESNMGADPMLAARFIRSEGLRLHVIGVGGPDPVKVYVHGEPFINTEDEHLETSLDDTELREIADAAGGTYRRAENIEALQAIFTDLARLQKTPLETSQLVMRSPMTPGIAGIVLCLVIGWMWLDAMILRRPWR